MTYARPLKGKGRIHVIPVRYRDIERRDPPAGRFRSVSLTSRLVPTRPFTFLGTYCVDTSNQVFALTYDDGPDPSSTPQVLDTLAAHGAVATFFVLADAAREHPRLLQRVSGAGHEIALHGADHRSLLTVPMREARRTIASARQEIEDIVGHAVDLYRPPYGAHTIRQAWMIRQLGLELILWSGDANDWLHDAETRVAARALEAVFPGSILLLHDTRADPETLGLGEMLPTFDRGAVLDRILHATAASGYTPMTISAMLAAYPRIVSLARQRMKKPLEYV